MYSWIWRHLPGPTAVRVLIVVLALVALFLFLMNVAYPAVERMMPYTDVSVS